MYDILCKMLPMILSAVEASFCVGIGLAFPLVLGIIGTLYVIIKTQLYLNISQYEKDFFCLDSKI